MASGSPFSSRESALKSGSTEGVSVVIEEFLAELEQGHHPSISEYLTRYPEQADVLASLLPAAAAMASLGIPSHPSGSKAGIDQRAIPFRELGDFRILRELGRGGMGVVYEAEQISLGRRIALKVLPFAGVLDPRQLQRFKNEARAAATLDHPHIVHVHAVGQDRGVHFYAMQLIEGKSLAEVISMWRAPPDSLVSSSATVDPERKTTIQSTNRNTRQATATGEISRLRFRQVIDWGIQAATALEYAHQSGIVHRDIKPSNLLVNAEGQLWVTDFGLAMTRSDTGITMTGDVLGTFRYMSPEQILGQRSVIDHRTDVYSLGLTLYELLALRPAFSSTDRAVLIRQVGADDPPKLPLRVQAVPLELETIIYKAISKESNRRYTTARELADDLQRYLDDRPIIARPPTFRDRLIKWTRRHQTLARSLMLTGVISLLTALVSLWFVQRALHQAELERVGRRMEANLAETQRDVLRQQQYSSRITLADRAVQRAEMSQAARYLAAIADDSSEADLRGFEWYYLSGIAQCQIREVGRHQGPIYHVCVGPDGKELYTCGKDGIRVWDLKTNELLRHLTTHKSDVNAVSVSPDGCWLISTGDDFVALVWDRMNWSVVARLPHQGQALGGFFSSDGQLFFSGERKETIQGESIGQNLVRVWETKTWSLVNSFPAGEKRLTSGDISDDGRRLAVADLVGEVKLLELPQGTVERVFQPFEDFPEWNRKPSVIEFAHQHPWYLTAGSGKVRIWDKETGGQAVPELSVPLQRVRTGMFSADDSYVFLSGEETAFWGLVQIWKWNAHNQYYLLSSATLPKTIWSMAVLDEREISFGSEDGTVYRWKIPYHDRELNWVSQTKGPSASAAFSREAQLLARTAERLEVHPIDHPDQIRVLKSGLVNPCMLAFSANGKMLAVQHGNEILLWNTSTWDQIASIPCDSSVDSVRYLRFVGDDHNLELMRHDTNRSTWSLDQVIPPVWDETCLPLKRDHEHECFFLISRPGTYRFCYQGKDIWERRIPNLNMAQASHDGSLLAVCYGDGLIEIYEAATGEVKAVCAGNGEPVSGLSFSHDLRTLLSFNRNQSGVALWHVSTGRSLLTLETRFQEISSAFFALDDRRIVIAGRDDQGFGIVRMIACDAINTPSQATFPNRVRP